MVICRENGAVITLIIMSVHCRVRRCYCEARRIGFHVREFGSTARPGAGDANALPGSPLLILCIHGAGYSGLTFAPLARALQRKYWDTGSSASSSAVLVAPDLRGHGLTAADNAEDAEDLSIDTLVEDIEHLYTDFFAEVYPKVVVVGWSMGAAVAVRAAGRRGGELASRVAGLVAIDVVEGTALEALKSMSKILEARPKGFESIDEAVEWAVSSGTVRCRSSAEISVPGMLVERSLEQEHSDMGIKYQQQESEENTRGDTREKGRTLHERVHRVGGRGFPPAPRFRRTEPPSSLETLREDSSISQNLQQKGTFPSSATNDVSINGTGLAPTLEPPRRGKFYRYTWRVALEKTRPYWTGWFQGLSQTFLDISAPKMLLLAGHDRLDKTLMIAQMQGKFQMAVIPHSGHAIHEDQPELVADKIQAFLTRYRLIHEETD